MRAAGDDQTVSTLRHRLRALLPTASVQTLRRMVVDGRVTVAGRRAARLDEPVSPGDPVHISPRRGKLAPRELNVIYEDEDLLVVHKPAGLLTATVPGERRRTLLRMVQDDLASRQPQARVGLIHRLDRDASGLLVFSRNDRAYRSLKSQFFHHTVGREYEALVSGRVEPQRGRIESRLVERADGTVHSTRQHGAGQAAITDYEVVVQREGLTLLRVMLHTGRKHQIRVHLSERGWPIVGDRVYGDRSPGKASSGNPSSGKPSSAGPLRLVAVGLELDHPRTGRRLTLRGPGLDRKL